MAASRKLARFLKLGNGFSEHAFLLVGAPLDVVGEGKIVVEVERLPALLQRLVVPASLVKNVRGRRVDDGRGRVQLLGPLNLGHSFIHASHRHQVQRVPLMSGGVAGVKFERLLEVLLCLRPLPIEGELRVGEGNVGFGQ